MKIWPLLVAAGLSLCCGPAFAAADERVETGSSRSDPLFPALGHASLALSTGVPFWVMGELSYGLTSHVAVGLLGGATPLVSGFGVRPRFELPMGDDWSVLGMASALYYPPNAMSREWWLARPSVLLERHFDWANVALGSGVVAAATSDALLGRTDSDRPASSPYPSSTPKHFDSGFWLTANAIGSVRLSHATHGFVDGALVLDRSLKLSTSDWIGGPPLIVFIGVETAL
jgi:hypothetical protein